MIQNKRYLIESETKICDLRLRIENAIIHGRTGIANQCIKHTGISRQFIFGSTGLHKLLYHGCCGSNGRNVAQIKRNKDQLLLGNCFGGVLLGIFGVLADLQLSNVFDRLIGPLWIPAEHQYSRTLGCQLAGAFESNPVVGSGDGHYFPIEGSRTVKGHVVNANNLVLTGLSQQMNTQIRKACNHVQQLDAGLFVAIIAKTECYG